MTNLNKKIPIELFGEFEYLPDISKNEDGIIEMCADINEFCEANDICGDATEIVAIYRLDRVVRIKREQKVIELPVATVKSKKSK